MDVALRRADRHARGARDVVVREAHDVAEDDDGALVVRERRKPLDEVAPDIAEDELRALALASDGVVKALAGRDVRTVVVRAPKLVNVVPA